MKFLVLFLMLGSSMAFSQPEVKYKYGCEGIVLFGRIGDSTLVYSNSMAKCEIKREVADSIVRMYLKKRPKSQMLSLNLPKANVKGRLGIIRKKTLISLTFYYEQVKWRDSITEIPIKRKKS